MQLSLRDHLTFPGGYAPGFDPSHIAANGCRFSAVASGQGGFTNLMDGLPGVPGTPAPTGKILEVGPTASYSGAGSTSFPGQSIVADQNPTFAAIFFLTDAGTNQDIFSVSSSVGSANWLFRLNFNFNSPQINLIGTGGNFTFTFSSFTANAPYFVACSCNVATNTGGSIATRLDNGTSQIAVQTGFSVSSVAPNGTYLVGNSYLGTTPFFGNLAAVMYSAGFNRQGVLNAWSQRPWDFWYPQTIDDYLFSELVGVSGAVTPNIVVIDQGVSASFHIVEMIGA